jgi:hypothetical protein
MVKWILNFRDLKGKGEEPCSPIPRIAKITGLFRDGTQLSVEGHIIRIKERDSI